MTHYFGIDWVAMGLTFSAIYLLGNKSRSGFDRAYLKWAPSNHDRQPLEDQHCKEA